MEATVLTPAGPLAEEQRRIAAVEIPSLGGVLDGVEGMAGAIWTVLQKVGPQKASVEFGVEVGLESGQVTGLFVKGTGKANLKITLEWGAANRIR